MDFDPEYPAGNYERMWRPLERFARKYVEDADAPPILPCEFMYVGAYVDCSPIVYAYKHKGSRHYLHLTSHGNVALQNRSGNWATSKRSVYSALAHLELHEFGGCWDLDDYCADCRE